MNTILGSTGMLGSMVARIFPEAVHTTRESFSVEKPDKLLLLESDWVINCIGLIKPYCTDLATATRVNAKFPYTLPSHTLQIATDCVYSGEKGNYIETDPHDATDTYGKTKSLGETPHIKNLRCSIIGPELKNHLSLLDWFLNQEDEVSGYLNHQWNGITTYHFAKICKGIIENNIELPNLQHIVPADSMNKAELLMTIAEVYKKDITVHPINAPEIVDRTLSTLNPKLNLRLWQAAGYEEPPTIKEMLIELEALK